MVLARLVVPVLTVAVLMLHPPDHKRYAFHKPSYHFFVQIFTLHSLIHTGMLALLKRQPSCLH